jgi:hypothetical protein
VATAAGLDERRIGGDDQREIDQARGNSGGGLAEQRDRAGAALPAGQ